MYIRPVTGATAPTTEPIPADAMFFPPTVVTVQTKPAAVWPWVIFAGALGLGALYFYSKRKGA